MRKFDFSKLDKLKDEKGMSYREVSRQAGIPFQSIHNWKSGKYQPDIKNVMLLSEMFSVPLDYWYVEGDK